MEKPIKTINYKGYEIEIYPDFHADPPHQNKYRFFVNYHRDFWIDFKPVVIKDEVRRLYQGEDIELKKDYHIYPVSSLIHSGVWLSLNKSFACDPQGWDTSHVGAVFVKKGEFKHPEQVAKRYLEWWNDYAQGEVYYFCITGLESRFGFWGDLEQSGLLDEAKAMIDADIKEKKRKHQEKVKSWIKNNTPLTKRKKSPINNF